MSDDIEKLITEIRGADGGNAVLAAPSSSERTWEDELRRRGSGFTRTTVHRWLWGDPGSVYSAPKIEALTWGPRSIYLVTRGYFEGYSAQLVWWLGEAITLWEGLLYNVEGLCSALQPDETYWSYTRIHIRTGNGLGRACSAKLPSTHLTLLALALTGSQDLVTLRCAPGPWLTALDEHARECRARDADALLPAPGLWNATIVVVTRERYESWLRLLPEEAGRPVPVVPWGGPLLAAYDLDIIRRASAVLTQQA